MEPDFTLPATRSHWIVEVRALYAGDGDLASKTSTSSGELVPRAVEIDW